MEQAITRAYDSETDGLIPCTHTSDWWKNFATCAACGEPYDDDEAERIGNCYFSKRVTSESEAEG